LVATVRSTMVSKVSKLVAIVLIAVVVAAGAGYWLFSPKPTSEIVNSTSEETSLEVNRTTPEQSLTASTSSSATTAAETTLWINITATKPVSYYLELLESNRTEPYVRLAKELRMLPDLTDGTAVAKITFLALNATNPEVKEAFQLMIKGGTPSPSDFQYTVPNYNTELEVLYWLACRNEFKEDDTLALAVSMVNGFWLTMGTDEVKAAVRNDTSGLLAFLRETNALQESRGYFRLEDLPLEAKIALAWTGDESMRHGYGPPIGLIYWTKQRLPIKIYDVDTVSVSTLIEMRAEASRNGWMQPGTGVESLVSHVEDYFYSFPYWGPRWDFREDYDKIVNDQGVMAVHDVDWQWARNERGLRFEGDCGTEMTIADAWLKSWGIATISEWAYNLFTQHNMLKHSHSFVIYYEPVNKVWKAYWEQISVGMPAWIADRGGNVSQRFDMFICRPPVIQRGYLREDHFESRTINGIYYASYWHYEGNMYYEIELTPWSQLEEMLSKGIPTSTMKEWLLYMEPVV